MTTLRIGTRGSRLALIQTDAVVGLLRARYPDIVLDVRVISTRPDRQPDTPIAAMGDKALFVRDIEVALRDADVDLAVHSLKDVPIAPAPGLELSAFPQRADPRDVLVGRGGRKLADLPAGAVVGTSSLRRAGQLLSMRPDLRTTGIRGNVDTRLRKLEAGEFDAVLLAAAGLWRMGLGDAIGEAFPVETFVPAAGQGALAVQCRAHSPEAALVGGIDDPVIRGEVEAERAFAAALGADCRTPVGACARRDGDRLWMVGEVSDPGGRRVVRVTLDGPASDPAALGAALAERALAAGAASLLPVD